MKYFAAALFIFGWWWIFQPVEDLPISPARGEYRVANGIFLEPISREELKQALAGDFSKMVELLIRWDATECERLDPSEFREMIHLFRNLKNENSIKVLPQTHVAATILLALAPKSIVAIPMGLRENEELFQKVKLESCPLNCQELEGEIVRTLAPDVAFVTTYSNPVFLKMLRHQRVPEVVSSPVTDLESLYATINEIAAYVEHPNEGKLLNLFIKGALLAIDNRLKGKKPEKVLYLCGNRPYFSPNPGTLLHELLHRLGIETFSGTFTHEDIKLYDPKLLLLAKEMGSTVQESPTQFAVLAYLDIANHLMYE